MYRLPLLFLLLLSVDVHAEWFCKEAASQRLGERLYHACGIASGNEQDARKRSLEAAFSEFKKLCDESSSCRGKETEILPKRTDCKKSEDGSYTCYRMIEVVVLRHDRSSIDINESELDAEISRKREELESLQSKLSKLAHLRRLEERAKELKELEKQTEETEVDLANLESKLSNAPMYMDTTSPWSGSVHIIYFNGPMERQQEGQFGFGFEGRRRILSWLSVGGGISYLSDFNEKEVEGTGPSSGTKGFPQNSDGWLINVDLGVQFKRLRIGPMFSHYSYSKDSITASYSSLGIKTGEQTTNVSGSDSGVGLKISYDFKAPLLDLYLIHFPDESLSYGLTLGVSF